MLGKLIKYEFKSTWKTFFMLDAVILILACVNKFTSEVTSENVLRYVANMSMVALIILLVASMFITMVLLIMRFYRSMIREEAYLTFTLPTTTSQILISKVLTAACWLLINAVVVVLATLLLVHDVDVINQMWRTVTSLLEKNGGMSTIISTGIYMFVLLFYYPLLFFAAMSIGQLFKSHKVLGTVVGYFILTTIQQVLSTVSLLVLSKAGIVLDQEVESVGEIISIFGSVTISSIIIDLIMIVICFVTARYLFAKKLNLE